MDLAAQEACECELRYATAQSVMVQLSTTDKAMHDSLPTTSERLCQHARQHMATRIPWRKLSNVPKPPKTTARGYGGDWQKVRRWALARDKWLCQDCLEAGRVKQASEVHHVVKIVADRSRRLDVDNLRCLCGACHDARTLRGE